MTFSILNYLDNRSSMVEYLLDNPDQIFGFSRARPGEKYVCDDRDRILAFLDSSPVVNPEHRPAIDSEGELLAYQLGLQFDNQKKEAFEMLTTRLMTETKKETLSYETIEKYK